jgi:hypothetical protein
LPTLLRRQQTEDRGESACQSLPVLSPGGSPKEVNMANVNSPRLEFTVNLPAELIEELKVVASYRQVSLDEVVTEACLAYTEPYLWEKQYLQWRSQHPNSPLQELGIDGKPLATAPEDQA